MYVLCNHYLIHIYSLCEEWKFDKCINSFIMSRSLCLIKAVLFLPISAVVSVQRLSVCRHAASFRFLVDLAMTGVTFVNSVIAGFPL